MLKPQVVFVTDPLCSWCWAMLPEMHLVRSQLSGWADFDLLMGGLQVGNRRPPVEADVNMLQELWRKVAESTGQKFLGQMPADPKFIYHSEVACRAVEAMRLFQKQPPWEFFEKLQGAFYLQARNLNSVDELGELAEPFGISPTDLDRMLQSSEVIENTRKAFESAKELGALALPVVLLDTGEGPKLVSGGYVTAEFLIPDLQSRIDAASGPVH
jgi:putative protein-disulfide isomerase|tara:strand:- start:407 stop:1048 length:642 start_codon:yes stop_codon:yes gene_type:complete